MSSIQISQVADVIDKWVQYCTPNEKKEFAEFTHEAKRTLDLIKSMEPGGDKAKKLNYFCDAVCKALGKVEGLSKQQKEVIEICSRVSQEIYSMYGNYVAIAGAYANPGAACAAGYSGIGIAKFGIDMLQKIPGLEPDPQTKEIQNQVFQDVGGGVGGGAATGALIGAFFGPIGAAIGAAVGGAYGGAAGATVYAMRDKK